MACSTSAGLTCLNKKVLPPDEAPHDIVELGIACPGDECVKCSGPDLGGCGPLGLSQCAGPFFIMVIYTHTHTHTYVCMYIYTYIYICVYMCIYMCVCFGADDKQKITEK